MDNGSLVHSETDSNGVTYHVEILTSHPRSGQNYESTFCGGEIIRNCESWVGAQTLAKIMDPSFGYVYVTERLAARSGSFACPLVRWQAVRLDILGSGRGSECAAEKTASLWSAKRKT